MTRKTKLVMLIALGSAVIVLAVLPFLLMTIPDPVPFKLSDISGERTGTYIVQKEGFFKLFPYTAPLFSFPDSALVADDSQPTVLIRFRQLDRLELYGIERYGKGEVIPVAREMRDAKTLELRPQQPLLPGDYVITAARDGADGGTDLFYFRVIQ